MSNRLARLLLPRLAARVGAAALLGALLAALAAAAPAQELGLRIGFLDTDRVLNESVQGRRAVETLQREFAPREKEILALQKRIEADRTRFDRERDKLSPEEARRRGQAIADMMRRSDQMVLAMTEDHARRKAELREKVIEEARAAIEAVARSGRYDLIVEQAIYRRPGIDVTDQVLKEMERRAAAAR